MGRKRTLAGSPARLIQDCLTRVVRPDPGRGDASAVMLACCTDMVFDETLGQAQVHHLHSQEEKLRFSCERVVVDPDRFNGPDLRKLLIQSELTSARWRCVQVAKIR